MLELRATAFLRIQLVHIQIKKREVRGVDVWYVVKFKDFVGVQSIALGLYSLRRKAWLSLYNSYIGESSSGIVAISIPRTISAQECRWALSGQWSMNSTSTVFWLVQSVYISKGSTTTYVPESTFQINIIHNISMRNLLKILADCRPALPRSSIRSYEIFADAHIHRYLFFIGFFYKLCNQ